MKRAEAKVFLRTLTEALGSEYAIIAPIDVINIWRCPECGEIDAVHPDYYSENGTLTCDCGADMKCVVSAIRNNAIVASVDEAILDRLNIQDVVEPIIQGWKSPGKCEYNEKTHVLTMLAGGNEENEIMAKMITGYHYGVIHNAISDNRGLYRIDLSAYLREEKDE